MQAEGNMNRTFSYRRLFHGNTLMVMIPHEDDEINIAGSLICGAREEGMQVICVFVTNGDYQYIPDVRIREAVRALAVLGVPKDDIVFLGYPDGGGHGEYSVFMHGQKEPIQAHGRTETCGGEGFPEFCAKESGVHHEYLWENLLKDLEAVILKYLPDGIAAIDWDTHPDHRMCSLAFDQVMGKILNERASVWQPVVLKAFAYATAFEGLKDFYRVNLPSTKINPGKVLQEGRPDNPNFSWDRRIRLPVPESCRTQDLGKNKIFHALTCHMSQKAMRRAEQIINGDQIFWEKRTQNLCFLGKVSVSSGDGRYLHDFCMMNTDDIVNRETVYSEYLWDPDQEDRKPWCRCEFETPQDIGASVFYGNIGNEGRILEGRLTFSTGYQVSVGALPENGDELYAEFPVQKGVNWVQFDILKREGPHAGLSEWELLASEDEDMPLLKICAADDFAYEWIVESGKPTEINAYNPSGKNLQWFLNNQPAGLEEINEICRNLQKPVHVCVEWKEQPDIRDEAVFLPDSAIRRIEWKLLLFKSRIISWWENQKEKRPHHKLRNFRNKS